MRNLGCQAAATSRQSAHCSIFSALTRANETLRHIAFDAPDKPARLWRRLATPDAIS
jgi:hypothetical protein